MKILTISNLYPPNVIGGAELVAHDLGVKLAAKGHEVSALTLGTVDEEYTIDGLTVKVLACNNFYPPILAKKKPGWLKPFWHLRDVYNKGIKNDVMHHIKNVAPDIIHCHNITGYSCAIWDCAKDLGIPVVQHIHDHQFLCIHAEFLRKNGMPCTKPHMLCGIRSNFIIGNMNEKISHIIFPSKYLYNNFIKFSNEKIHKINFSIIPNGTDYADQPLVDSIGNTGVFSILFLGHLAVNKGYPVFEQAMRMLINKKANVDIHIAGTGPLFEKAKAFAAEFNNVSYHGYVRGEFKLTLFRNTHVYIFPSLCYENSPLTIAESSALGIPVLASRIGGIPELVHDQWLFEPGNSNELVNKIEYLEHNRNKVQEESRELVHTRAEFGMTNIVNKIEKIYMQLMI